MLTTCSMKASAQAGPPFKFVSQSGQFHFISKRICKRLITQGLLRAVNGLAAAISPPHIVCLK